MQLTVPANLLLCGEYSILESGRLAVAVALDIRARFSLSSADRFRVEPVYPGAVIGKGERDPLTGAVVAAFFKYFPGSLPEVCIRADTNDFYGQDGSKLGLGSSAVAAVGISALLYYARFGKRVLPREVYLTALEGHRHFQGGGSGYDVAASFHGGIGLFTSGTVPGWEKLHCPELPVMRLVRGEKPQSSVSASAAWCSWQKENGILAERYCSLSDRGANMFVSALKDNAAGALARLRRPGAWLGRQIGVPAYPDALAGQMQQLSEAGWGGKASGAGGELGVAFAPRNGYSLRNGRQLPGVEVRAALEGIKWSQ